MDAEPWHSQSFRLQTWENLISTCLTTYEYLQTVSEKSISFKL